MRLGKLTDYATVLLVEMARAPERCRPAGELARATGLGEPTVGKLCRLLGQAGLVSARRGANGGYHLARRPADISIADVVSVLEGPIALTRCIEHGEQCPMDTHCQVQANWWQINDAIERALASVTLADMIASSPAAPPKEIPLRRMDPLPARTPNPAGVA